MTEKEKENRIHSFALSFLERQQIIPNLYADQIIRGYKEGYHQAEKDLKVKEVEEPSKDLKEAARRAAVDKPDTPLEFLMERPYDSVKEQKFIEGAMWQKRHDNIPQELVENYCEFIKEGGKNVCALINAVNACNAKKAECISNDLEEAASQYSFNIPSAIFNDLTPVLQNIWKREIEGAFVAGAKWYKEQLKDK